MRTISSRALEATEGRADEFPVLPRGRYDATDLEHETRRSGDQKDLCRFRTRTHAASPTRTQHEGVKSSKTRSELLMSVLLEAVMTSTARSVSMKSAPRRADAERRPYLLFVFSYLSVPGLILSYVFLCLCVEKQTSQESRLQSPKPKAQSPESATTAGPATSISSRRTSAADSCGATSRGRQASSARGPR